MSRGDYLLRAVVSLPLLLLAGCGLIVNTEVAEIQEPLPSTVVVFTYWNQGGGFLVDRNDRLIVTSNRVLDGAKEVEVAFPAVEEGKAVVKREYYADPSRRVKARVVGSSPENDLAIVQVESLPIEMRELKLAGASASEGSSVRFLGDARNGSLWGAQTANVTRVADLKLSYPNGPKITGRVVEMQAPSDVARPSRGSPVLNEAGEVVGVIGGGDGALLTAVDVNSTRRFLGVVYRYLASTAFDHHDYKMALAHCDRSLSINPNDALAHNERGAALSYLDRYDDAMAAYTAAIKADPNLATAYRNRGSAYLHKGEYSQAIADCSAAIRLDPGYLRAYETRRLAYAKLAKSQEASADEKQVLALSQVTWKSAEPFPTSWFPAVPQYKPYATGQYESKPFPPSPQQPDRGLGGGSSSRGGGQRPIN